MIRATYADLKPSLARIAGVSGMNVSDPRVLAYTNLAIQELMDEDDWPSLVTGMRFKVTTPYIRVPSEFDRILMLKVNDVPLPMQSPWYEYVGQGPGFLNNLPTVPVSGEVDQGLLGRLRGVVDRGQVAVFQDIPSDGSVYYPTVYADPADAGKSITIQGYDNNQLWVRTNNATDGFIDGITLTIPTVAPFQVTSSQAFGAITGIRKDRTANYLSLYVSSTAQSNYFIGMYAPYDTAPYYRYYKIPNLTDGVEYCIDARCRRRYTPIYSDTDWLLIPNLPALSSMVQAVYYREANDVPSYATYKQIAVEILRKEMTAYIGQQRQKPLITMNEGMGVRRDGILIL